MIMRFWMRELLGWFLVLLGLFLFYWDLSLLLDERASKYLQAMAMLPIAIFVFRGGIQLLKVAVAARMCSYAQKEVSKQDVRRPVGSPVKDAIGQDW
jgi:hypothetical protein